MDDHKICYHALVSKDAPHAIDLEIMRAGGFAGIEANIGKMRAYLQAGHREAELAALMQDIYVPGAGFLLDIERQGADQAALLREAEDMFHIAKLAGAEGVQVLTGPVQVAAVEAHARGETSPFYAGLLHLPKAEQLRLTAANFATLADMAKEQGLLLYLEALAWTPLNRLADQVALIDAAGRDNLRLVVDFWHCYASGDAPEEVARLPKELIHGVHVCDSLTHDCGIPNEAVLRDVPTGAGVLNLMEWVDAVKSTGYVGWWSCELFCRRQQQENSFDVARTLKDLMERLVRG
ncbi:sugar phosphate isomerase/epimerase family protein [Phaeovulum sp. W22_SRMD_FR3]|uniref:sugar phosphate isomerase/epimerase family protein n=1 Tax=Phaeovulum sp. W22_SRMD_FR3 TaxID=3240274 RepID=UPI003F9BF07D